MFNLDSLHEEITYYVSRQHGYILDTFQINEIAKLTFDSGNDNNMIYIADEYVRKEFS